MALRSPCPATLRCDAGIIDPADPQCPTKTVAPEKLRGLGAILLSALGRRFVNELGRRDEVSAVSACKGCSVEDNALLQALRRSRAWDTVRRQTDMRPINVPKTPCITSVWKLLLARVQAILAQPGKQAVLLFGAATADAFGPALHSYLSSKLIQRADSLAGLEGQAGLPAEAVGEELAAYSRAAAAGRDSLGKVAFPASIDPSQVCGAFTVQSPERAVLRLSQEKRGLAAVWQASVQSARCRTPSAPSCIERSWSSMPSLPLPTPPCSPCTGRA